MTKDEYMELDELCGIFKGYVNAVKQFHAAWEKAHSDSHTDDDVENLNNTEAYYSMLQDITRNSTRRIFGEFNTDAIMILVDYIIGL